MKEIAAREAKNHFGERQRGAAWTRLTETMDRLGAEATARGLTSAELDRLVADDGRDIEGN